MIFYKTVHMYNKSDPTGWGRLPEEPTETIDGRTGGGMNATMMINCWQNHTYIDDYGKEKKNDDLEMKQSVVFMGFKHLINLQHQQYKLENDAIIQIILTYLPEPERSPALHDRLTDFSEQCFDTSSLVI